MTESDGLQGMRFGRLTVTEKAGEPNLWRCRCDCGKVTVLPEPYLQSAVITSCGCKRSRVVDLGGKRFGHLTAIEPVPQRSQDNSVQWLCRCDCGETTVVSSNKLRMGHTKSCGCQKLSMINEGKTFVDGTCLEILFSEKLCKKNTSGHTGVARRGKKWQAYITYSGRLYWLGTYQTRDEAIEARRKAEDYFRERVAAVMREAQRQTIPDPPDTAEKSA